MGKILTKEKQKDLWFLDIEQFAKDLFPHYIGHLKEFPDFQKKVFRFILKDDPAWTRLERTRVIIAPRGFGKTTLMQIYVLYNILFRRKHFIVFMSETKEQAESHMGAVKDELSENDTLKWHFGDASAKFARNDRGQWRTDLIETNWGCKIWCRGRDQGFQGIKYRQYRPDLFLPDDIEPRKPEDVRRYDSIGRRIVRNRFFNVMEPAVDIQRGEIDYIGTMTHNDCLIAHLLKNPHWKKLEIGIVDKGRGYEIDDGEPTWPEVYPKQRLRKIRQRFAHEHNLAGWAREYLGVATADEERDFRDEDFLRYEGYTYRKQNRTWLKVTAEQQEKGGPMVKVAKDFPINVGTGVDLSGFGQSRDSDWSWYSCCGMDEDGHVWSLDQQYGRYTATDALDKFFDIDEHFDPELVERPPFGVEENAQKALYNFDGGWLAEKEQERNRWLNLMPVHEYVNKVKRVQTSLHGRVKAGTVHVRKNLDDTLVQAFVNLGSSAHDDGPDAMEKAVRVLSKAMPSKDEDKSAYWDSERIIDRGGLMTKEEIYART